MTSPEFIACQTSHMSGFKPALGERLMLFPGGLREVWSMSLRNYGLWGALEIAFSTRDGEIDALADRNLQRKRIRVPSLFNIVPVAWIYRETKRIHCRLLAHCFATLLDRNSGARAIIFNGHLMPESILALAATRNGMARLFMEKGFFPNTCQCDPWGINYLSSLPRDPAFYRALVPERLGNKPLQLVKRASKQPAGDQSALPEKYVLVPFQVPSDMQILALSPWVHDMEHLYRVIRNLTEHFPESRFVIKEHPSFPLSIQNKVERHPHITFANHHDTQALIEGADAVITVNSTVGLESVLLEKKVITLGLAPYNIDGIVLQADSEAALVEHFSNLANWAPDAELRELVTRYIYNVFLLKGEILKPDIALINALEARASGSDHHSRLIAAFEPNRAS